MTADAALGLDSLRRLSRRAALWTALGQMSGQVLRLGSNLILTRLLVPEFFGVMVLVNVYVLGLQLFSDIGLGPNIIQHRRGDEPEFLNTAWSIQIGRGVMLWLVAWALSGVMASAYDEPQLNVLLPVASLAALLNGFESTNRYTLNRKIHLGRITILELGHQLASVAFMVTWAFFSPTIWALVAGSLFGTLVRTVSSHVFLPGIRNRLSWDRSAARSLIRFGKWIFLGTALGFLANRGDRLILGAVMSKGELGMFSVAVILAHSPARIAGQIARKVLLPLYSRVAAGGSGALKVEIRGVRMRLVWLTASALAALSMLGEVIITSFWPESFAGAGPMTRILAIGSIGTVTISTLQPVLLACGDARAHFVSTLTRAVTLLSALYLGEQLGGMNGALIGLAVAPTLHYPMLAWLVARHGAWTPSVDLGAFALSVILAVGLWMTM